MSASHRAEGECNEMAAAHISTEEGRSTRQYDCDSSIPARASAKVIHAGPKPELKASEWLHSGKSGGDFPDRNAGTGIISLRCFCSDWMSVPVLLF